MKIMLIIKAVAALLVLGAMGGTAYLMQEYTGTVKDMPGTMMERQRKVELELKQKAERGIRSDNEPGEKAFQRAKELLAMESMVKAEEKLKYIVSFYPSAKCASEARRILGEINVDRLLDPEWKEGKTIVKVKSGDTFTRIVSKNKTTMDSLVHLSKLMRADHRSLHPGDKLTVMPLEMRVVIDNRRKTLTLWKGGEFIKEYPMQKISFKGKKAVTRLKVGNIRGWYRGKLYPSHAEEYRASSKVIALSDKSLAMRAVSEDDEEGFGLGFLLTSADMEELPLLLRPGNEVEIRN
jgi:hypothetical protein